MRIFFTLITSYLLQINGLKTIGGLLLLYIAYKLYKNVIKSKNSEGQKIKTDIQSGKTLTYCGVIFRAMDNGYRNFIIICGQIVH